MTLSCNELVSITYKLNRETLTDENINNMTYFERCNYTTMQSIAKHFQYRVEVFFKEVIVNAALGKEKYYEIRVEFQVPGSPHIHSFVWVLNTPVLTKDIIDE